MPGRRRLAAALACLALTATGLTGASTRAPHPVLEYASSLSFPTMAGEADYRRRLAEAEGELRRHDIPGEDCARSLGAARFAALLEDVAEAHAATGDAAGAILALRRALACTPRAAQLYADLAAGLSSLGREQEARAAALRGLSIAPDNADLNDAMAQLDFVAGRATDAEPRIRRAMERTAGTEQHVYWQLLLNLAQRRARVADPELAPEADLAGWPLPLADLFLGRGTEREIVAALEAQRDETRRREMLVEALYYVGELRLVQGETDLARRHFAAVVNVKVPYFVEHRLARAQLARMRSTAAVQ